MNDDLVDHDLIRLDLERRLVEAVERIAALLERAAALLDQLETQP